MSGFGFDDDEEDRQLLRPVWEDNSAEDDLLPSERASRIFGGAPMARAKLSEPAERGQLGAEAAALAISLSDAEDALSRADAAAGAASPEVRAGLIARMAYREASGWMASTGFWVHPNDLALRDLGMTGSYTAAAEAGKLLLSLPNTLASDDREDASTVPEDRLVQMALALSRALSRLAQTATWTPLETPGSLSAAMEPLGLADYSTEIAYLDWRPTVTELEPLPPLPRAVEEGMLWRRQDDYDGADLRASFVSAAAAKASGRLRFIPLPVWAARYGIVGSRRIDGTFVRKDSSRSVMLRAIAEGARAAVAELERLTATQRRGRALLGERSRRSRTAEALDAVIQTPCLTSIVLASRLKITPTAARRMLLELAEAGLIKETTGRRSFRAFSI